MEYKDLVSRLDVKIGELEKKEEEACNEAVEQFGVESQLLKAVEELNELGQALCKYLRCMNEDTDDREPDMLRCLVSVKEELADVHLMMLQLHTIFGDNHEMRQIKLEHLQELLGTGDLDV